MEDYVQNKNYELAFHITPDLEGDEVRKETSEIEAAVKKAGGNIVFLKEPAMTRLSYPIGHKKSAYFGFVDFNAPPEAVEKISSEMKLQIPVLRYMVLQKEATGRRPAPAPRMTTHKAPKIKEEPSAKPEELEKELEEVLGKL